MQIAKASHEAEPGTVEVVAAAVAGRAARTDHAVASGIAAATARRH